MREERAVYHDPPRNRGRERGGVTTVYTYIEKSTIRQKTKNICAHESTKNDRRNIWVLADALNVSGSWSNDNKRAARVLGRTADKVDLKVNEINQTTDE